MKNPLDFYSISDRSVPLGMALLPWVYITALASSGAKPRPRGQFSLRWKKNLRDFSFPMRERDIYSQIFHKRVIHRLRIQRFHPWLLPLGF